MTTTTTTPALIAGTRFERTESRNWTSNGTRRTHVRTMLCEVVLVTTASVRWRVLEVTAEENRPSFAGDPTGGEATHEGFQRSIDRGETRVLTGPTGAPTYAIADEEDIVTTINGAALRALLQIAREALLDMDAEDLDARDLDPEYAAVLLADARRLADETLAAERA